MKKQKLDSFWAFCRKSMAILTCFACMAVMSGCGQDKNAESILEGSCTDILNQVYEKADLDAEVKEAMKDYMLMPIDEETMMQVLGTTEVTYSDSAYSTPLINIVPYQCVILRLEKGVDIEGAKATLLEAADPRKWVCVEAESTIVENVGDVVLCIMADDKTATAVKEAFLSLK